MYLTRMAISSVLAAGGLGLGLAVPASAADVNALGSYTFEANDGESATWTVTPCVDDDEHCVHVAETGNSKRAPWSANAYWSVGSWIMFVDQPDAILCNDGTTVPGRNTYSWDATSRSGYVSIYTTGACGQGAQSIAIPMTLTKIGSGPIQYPTGPVQDQPYVPAPQDVSAAPAAPMPAEAMPVETDPNIVATPPAVQFPSDQLTEAEVAQPGFNATPGGGSSGPR
jgi:hypothetical protein